MKEEKKKSEKDFDWNVFNRKACRAEAFSLAVCDSLRLFLQPTQEVAAAHGHKSERLTQWI